MSSTNGPPDVADISPPVPNSTHMATPPAFAFARLLEPQYLLVVLSALGIIWLGAHGSLRRPPSAAPAKLKKGERRQKEAKFAEGLVASDAIMFPILLGAVLIGLYYLIQWLQDPAILNKVLRGYMSIMSIAGLGTFSGDALDILTSLVFPSMWADGTGQVYHIDPNRRCQYKINKETGEETVIKGKETPLPGLLSNLARSQKTNQFLWDARHLLNQEWTLRLAVKGVSLVKLPIRLNDLVRFTIAGAIAIVYHLTEWHAMSNLLSFAMCYVSFTMFSPTSFGIGTMVLAGLFVYDIVMVFYTPYMITVAKKLDAPIKLVFTSAKGASMLGLGDIVVPGMLMALALRFDLYRHYEKQIKLEPVELTTELASSASTDTTKTVASSHRRIKTPFASTHNQWGNRLWTTPLGSLRPVRDAMSATAAIAFPKPYFYASVVGYAAGMFVTLTVMLVFNHGQPALLYLVPGVTGSLWLTAAVRGEIGEVWGYTEDGSLDVEDVVVDVEVEGKKEKGEGAEEVQGKVGGEKEKEKGEKEKEKKKKANGHGNGHYELFVLSITAPRSVASVS